MGFLLYVTQVVAQSVGWAPDFLHGDSAEAVEDALQTFIIPIALTYTATYYFGMRKARHWKKRVFTHRINASLNFLYMDENRGVTLGFRTVFEKDVNTLMPNEKGVEVVDEAARLTTPENPFLILNEDDQRAVMPALVNQLSEAIGAVGWFSFDCNLPVVREKYVLGLTCEKAALVRQEKVRIMLIRESLLRKIPEMAEPCFEADHHRPRWQTLQVMSKEYQRQGRNHCSLEVFETCVPAPERGRAVHSNEELCTTSRPRRTSQVDCIEEKVEPVTITRAKTLPTRLQTHKSDGGAQSDYVDPSSPTPGFPLKRRRSDRLRFKTGGS